MTRRRDKRINAGEVSTKGRIRKPELPRGDHVVFSFKYLDMACKKFRVEALPKNFGRALLERLQGYCKMPFNEFVAPPNPDAIHSHRVVFGDTSEQRGFGNIPAELWQERPWQCQLQGKIRAIGFLLGSVFHVVWIDVNHRLYPRK